MSFEEKMTWCYALLTPLVYGIYVAVLLNRAQSIPLAQVSYAGAMLWSMGSMIVTSIVSAICISIGAPGECGKKDIRDKEIHRYGEYVGHSFIAVACLAAIILSMLKAPHFWIANAIYLGCVLSTLLSSATKLYIYRRGLPSC